MNEAANGTIAVCIFTVFSFSVVDLELMGKVSSVSFYILKILQGGTTGVNGRGQNLFYRLHQAFGADAYTGLSGDAIGCSAWRYLRHKQSLTSVYITYANDDLLIEERGFDGT